MNDLNIDQLKSSLNIIDIIDRYVPLKKSSSNYFGVCPFHAEKTASFSVDEKDQFYHCFGCGAHGDVISFVMEYSGLSFIDAYKELGGEIDVTPTDKIKENQARSACMIHERVPPDHRQDEVKSANILSKMVKNNSFKPFRYEHERGIAFPIYTAKRKLVNVAIFARGERMKFAAGGLSYNGFTPIKVNNSNDFVACTSVNLGRILAVDHGFNVAVCWNDHVLKYICKWNYGDLNIIPAITKNTDDYLCYEMDWLKIESIKLGVNITKMEMLNV